MRTEFLAGVRAEIPLMLGALPFGLIYGALAREAGIPPAAALAMSSIVFAGSAQFIGTELFASGSPGAVILLTTFVVNLRHLGPAWKWLLGYLLTDEAYAVTITRFQVRTPTDADRHWFFLGAGLTLWAGWQLSTAAGVLLAAGIPTGWDLEFALPLIFIAIIVPMLTDRGTRLAALTAAVVAVAAAGAPLRAGLIAGALAGITAGWLVDRG